MGRGYSATVTNKVSITIIALYEGKTASHHPLKWGLLRGNVFMNINHCRGDHLYRSLADTRAGYGPLPLS